MAKAKKTRPSKPKGKTKAKPRPSKGKRSRKTPYTIVNMVASSELNVNLNLVELVMALPNVEFEPEQFPGAIVRLTEPHSTLLVFGNGKIVCTGANNEETIARAIGTFMKQVNKAFPALKLKGTRPFEVSNMVASSELNRVIDLYSLAMLSDSVEYEAEQFPGAIIRFKNPKVVILLFRTGKLICAGAKSRKDIELAIQKADKLIRECSVEKKPEKK
ncbi:MAG TPA: TATA-box-binding protein [archaeon]|nr:TATA-box-binding protein [archaeon]